jgi:GTP cyclohydrolase I
MSQDRLEELVAELLRTLGRDSDQAQVAEASRQIAVSLRHLTEGYGQDPRSVVGETLLAPGKDEMVLLKDIPFYSLCEHHLLPFFGFVHVAYLPQDHLLGLGKIPRLVDVFARRLQLQERMTTEIAQSLLEVTQARGVGIVVEARHLCLEMRGASRTGQLVTSRMLGRFGEDANTRQELFSWLGNISRSRTVES